MQRRAHALSPWIRLFDPNSVQVASSFGPGAGDFEHQALLGGTYTVLAADGSGGGMETGSYKLHYVKAPGTLSISGGDEGGALTNGSAHPGLIEIGDLDGYQFEVDAGDSFVLHAGDLSGSTFFPWIRVFDPNGDKVVSNFGGGAADLEYQAVVGGTYTVAIADGTSGGAESGSYALHFLETSGSLSISAGDEGGALTNGSVHPGTIDVGDLDGYRIELAIDDSIVAHVGDVTPPGMTPWLRLFAPNGDKVASNFGSGAAFVEHRAVVAGSYTVAVADGTAGGELSGDYDLHVARMPSGGFVVPPGDQGGALTNGGAHPGFISVGDVDMWEFGATTGAMITLEAEDTGGNSLTPWIRLYDPTGENVAAGFSGTLASIAYTAAIPGRYVVVVTDGTTGVAESGTYELRYDSTGDVPLAVVPIPIAAPLLLGLLLLATGAVRSGQAPRPVP